MYSQGSQPGGLECLYVLDLLSGSQVQISARDGEFSGHVMSDKYNMGHGHTMDVIIDIEGLYDTLKGQAAELKCANDE